MKELLIKHNIQELNENEINDLFVIYSGILSNYYKDKKEGYQILETFLDGSPINLTNPSKFEEISKVYWEIIQDQKEKELKNKLIKYDLDKQKYPL